MRWCFGGGVVFFQGSGGCFFFFFFFKQKTAYEMQRGLVGSEMCIRDRLKGELENSVKIIQNDIKENKELIESSSKKAEELKKTLTDLVRGKSDQHHRVLALSLEQKKKLSLIHI
eukprot:TRINITY_DN4457_c0_g1_i2.p1 TRINITY_DN4457_c0_g1~~TRINITY_DN4457_c0_g1_i2.p1  ORF type:complete len:115 (+),score=45.98 TRINITY_DN4457_c0_g1_i2:68-412(+)